MDESKPFYKSRGVVGALVVLVGVIVQALGYTWGPDDQQVAVTLISTTLEAIGGLVALWGRVKATKPIALKAPPAPPAAAVVLLLCMGLMLGAAGCAANNEIKTPLFDKEGKPLQTASGQPVYTEYKLTDEAMFYKGQADTIKERAKPVFEMKVPEGKQAVLPGGTKIIVRANGGMGTFMGYRPWYADVAGQAITGGLGAYGYNQMKELGVAGINAVANSAGHNTTIHGDNIGRDKAGRDNVGGDVVGGDKAGRDITRDSHNQDSHDATPAPATE